MIMNNNDTNNLGNNGGNSTNLGGNTPVSNGPINGGMEQLGEINNQATQVNNVSGGNLENSMGMMNATPGIVTSPTPTPAPAPMDQGVQLLDPNPNVVPTPVPTDMNLGMNQPQDMNNMTLGSISDNQVGVMNTNPGMITPQNPTSTPVPMDQNAQVLNSNANMTSSPSPTDMNLGMNQPQQPQDVNNMPFGNFSDNSMNMNLNNNPAPVDMAQNGINPNPFVGNSGMSQPMMSGDNPFAQPNMGMNPNMNNNVFGSVPTPPMGNMDNGNKKGKLKFSKTTIIIIVVLLIAIIGCAVYLILNNATPTQTKGSITAHDLDLDLGKPLSTNISDYAEIVGFNVSTCTLDTSSVNIKRMGSYDYTITCGTTTQKGTIMLRDKTAPTVTVRELMVTPGTNVALEDFIVTCDDYTKCSYELEDANESLETLVQTVGNYNLNLIVSDDYDNKVTVQLSLIVSDSAPVRYMYCTPTSVQDDTLKATLDLAYNYGINMDDMLAKTEKTYVYTFDNEEDYLETKNSYSETTGVNGVVGQTVFDDENFTITILVNMTDSDLGIEFNMNPFPTDYEGLRQFNIEQGITCKNR